MFNPLKTLGKLGKGLATLVGLSGVAVTSVALETPGFNLNETLAQVLEILRVLLALLAAAGFGRKTGYAASD